MQIYIHTLFPIILSYGYIIIGVLILVECLGVPLPGETSLITGSIIASQYPGRINIFLVILTAIIAASLGDNIGYFIGKNYGENFIKFLNKSLKVNIKYIPYTKKFFEKYGLKSILIGRFISVFRVFIPITAGIHRIEYRPFFIYNIAGAILWSVFYGLLGFFLGKNLPLLESITRNLTYITVLAIVILIAYFLFKRFERRRYEKL
jgi:membrane protein DedA with SNARE-associated domain